MKKLLISYADTAFSPYQAINLMTGLRFGFDDCHAYGPQDIDVDFAQRHAATLRQKRGAGYWLWKPYILAAAMAKLSHGDFLFYADAAMHFVNPIDPMVAALEQHKLDLLILGEGFAEAVYTKRDAFVLMDADTPSIVGSPQRFASCFMLRKSPWSESFLQRYLSYCEDERILTDQDNLCGLPNYPGFVAHRHDQSVFSLLSKLDSVPVVVGDLIVEGLSDRGRQIINHTRSHFTPAEIVRYLLIEGILKPADLPHLTSQAEAGPLP